MWLVYAGGIQYLLLSALLYAPGALFFAKAKRELGAGIQRRELIFAAVLIGAIAAYGLYDGFLSSDRRPGALSPRPQATASHSAPVQTEANAMTQQPTKLGVHSEAGKLRKVWSARPASAHPDAEQLRRAAVRRRALGQPGQRDHFDFVTKMRERGVEVLEMLTETVSNPVALKWILDRKITANQVGIGLHDEVRSWLEEQQPGRLPNS